MEVEYEKNEIMDKINSYFGYRCISRYLKITQDNVNSRKKFFKN